MVCFPHGQFSLCDYMYLRLANQLSNKYSCQIKFARIGFKNFVTDRNIGIFAFDDFFDANWFRKAYQFVGAKVFEIHSF